VELALQTGLRVSEMAALRCEDLRHNDSRAGVAIRRGKGGKPRYVRINRFFCGVIERYLSWKRETGEQVDAISPVFKSPRREGSLTVRALQKRFANILERVDITGHCLHHTRHTYATNLYLASGGDLRLVQQQLGHSRVTTTEIYAAVLSTSLQSAVERLYKVREITE